MDEVVAGTVCREKITGKKEETDATGGGGGGAGTVRRGKSMWSEQI